VVVADLGALVLEGRGPAEDAWHFELDDTEPPPRACASRSPRSATATSGRGGRCFATTTGSRTRAPTSPAVQPGPHGARGPGGRRGGPGQRHQLAPVNFRVDGGGGWRARHHRERPPQPHRPASGRPAAVLRRHRRLRQHHVGHRAAAVSMATPHLCAIELVLVPRNWEARRAAQRPRRLGDHQRDGRRAAPSPPAPRARGERRGPAGFLLDRHEHEPVQGPRGHGRSHRGQPLRGRRPCTA